MDLNKEIIFFGHSLAPVFILHLVDECNIQIKAAVFVSPFLDALISEDTWQFDVVNRSFYKTDFNWEKLKKLIPHSYVIYGTKDPYVPSHLPIYFASQLHCEIIPVENGKHLGSELVEFPLLLDVLKKIQQ